MTRFENTLLFCTYSRILEIKFKANPTVSYSLKHTAFKDFILSLLGCNDPDG